MKDLKSKLNFKSFTILLGYKEVMYMERAGNVIAILVLILILRIGYSILSKLFLNGMKFVNFIKFISSKLKKLKDKKKGSEEIE